MPSSLHIAIAFLHVFSWGVGQSKICCQENMLKMMSQEMREETAQQAVAACARVFA